MTRESTDVDTAEQVIDSFRILAADKVRFLNSAVVSKHHYVCPPALSKSVSISASNLEIEDRT